jgi:NADH:ubiquinone oxidoreductase subunit E
MLTNYLMTEPITELHQCTCNQVHEDELYERLKIIVQSQRTIPGALIPVLQTTQNLFGYLPEKALRIISKELKLPYSEVAGVVGFYSYFSTIPKGKHTVRVCMGTACYVRGGQDVLKAMMKELEIGVGGTTADRKFSLEVGRCFGACGLAPVVLVDDETFQRVKPSKVSEILNSFD